MDDLGIARSAARPTPLPKPKPQRAGRPRISRYLRLGHPPPLSARRFKKSEAVLRGKDVFGVGFDLDGGEAGGVPAAAKGFDQEDAGD